MGQKNDIATNQATIDRGQLRGAIATITDLARGEYVSPDLADAAKGMLINALWNKDQSQSSLVQGGVLVYYECLENPEDRAELLGEVIAAGLAAGTIWDYLAQRSNKGVLSAEELAALRQRMQKSPRSSLEFLAGLLPQDPQPGEIPPPPGSPKPRPHQTAYSETAIRERQAGTIRAEDTPHVGPGAEDPTSWHQNLDVDTDSDLPRFLANGDVPEEGRLSVALEHGSESIPVLADLLGTNQTEFGVVALMHLGKSPETRQAVYNAMLRQELTDARKPAECVRRAIQDDRPDDSSDPGGRSRLQDAGVENSWLIRALNSCDAPSIMCAAKGREVQAIPRLMRKLASLRRG